MSDQNSQIEQAGKITDSPWFWGYLFCTLGLILLVVFQSKLVARQQEIDREGYARQVSMNLPPTDADAADSATHEPTTTKQPSPRLRLTLLYGLFAVALVAAWLRLCVVHFGRSRPVVASDAISPSDGGSTHATSHSATSHSGESS